MTDVIDAPPPGGSPTGDLAGAGDAPVEGAASSLERLSDDELTVIYDAAVDAVRHAASEQLTVAAEIDRRQMWRTDGTSSLRAWMAMRDGEGDGAARRWSAVGRMLPSFPLLAAALADGRLSFDHVRLLLVLAELTGRLEDADADADLVALGERHTVPQLETACRSARRIGRKADREGHDRRSLRWWCDEDGTFHLRGRLHGTDGLTVTNLLSAMATDAEPDPATGMYDPFEARCADALVEVCTGPPDHPTERAAVVIHAPLGALGRPDRTTTPPGRHGGSNGADTDVGDPTDPDTPGGGSVGSGGDGTAMSWDGTAIADDTLRRLLCDTRFRAVLHDDDGRTVGIGRRSRTIPSWLLDQLRWRDRGCRFPGCGHTRWLHGHHLRHWADGGPTNLDNLALMCQRHHRSVHEGEWRISGDPDDLLTFVGPHGQTFTSAPAVETPTPRRRRRRPPGTGRRRARARPPGP